MPHKSSRMTGRLLLLANLLFANGIAAFVVIAFVRPSAVGLDLGAMPEAAQGPRVLVLSLESTAGWLVFLSGLGLLLANFAWLVRRSGATAPEPFVLSETPGGVVRIAREALENALQKAGETLPEVTRCRVQVQPQGPKRFAVRGQFHCAEGTSSMAASQRLRAVLATRAGELVRLPEGGRVEFDLEFCGFFGKLGKGAEVAPAEDEAAPFTGPRYPIDDDSGSVT